MDYTIKLYGYNINVEIDDIDENEIVWHVIGTDFNHTELLNDLLHENHREQVQNLIADELRKDAEDNFSNDYDDIITPTTESIYKRGVH